MTFIRRDILIIILFVFSSSAIPLNIYENARFNPNAADLFLQNLSQIASRNECACQCYFDQLCLTATYSAIDQQCSLFFAWLQQSQLHLVVILKQSSVLHFPNKTLPLLSLLTSTNETVYGVWNTTAGTDSLLSSLGDQPGCYFSGEEPQKAFDGLNSTKYTNFGVCNSTLFSHQCGLNSGLYLTLQRGPSLLRAVRFCTGNSIIDRDPLIITIEGSNHPPNALSSGLSWSLIYNGSTGLDNATTRETFGTTEILPNNYIWYTSYRILVTSKRGYDTAVEYSEIELLGY